MNRRKHEETKKGPALGPIGWTDLEWPPGYAVEIIMIYWMPGTTRER